MVFFYFGRTSWCCLYWYHATVSTAIRRVFIKKRSSDIKAWTRHAHFCVSVSNYSTEGTVFICEKYIKNSGNKFGGVQGYLGTLITTSNSTRSWFTADIVQRDTEFRGIIWKEDEASILVWR